MRKKTIFSFLFILSMQFYANCQKNSPLLAGYRQEDYRKYFDSINVLSKTSIQSLNHSYDCWILIKIDTLGNISDFEFIEVPEAPLPSLAKEYLKDIFMSTSGKWTPAKIPTTASESILFWVLLKKANQPIEQYMKDTENTFEFLFMKLGKLPSLNCINTDDDIHIILQY